MMLNYPASQLVGLGNVVHMFLMLSQIQGQ